VFENSLFTTKVIDIQKLLSVVERAFVMSFCFAFSHMLTDRKKAVPFQEFVKERRTIAVWLFSLILITIIIFDVIKRVQFQKEISWSKEIFYGSQIACLMTLLMLLLSGSIRFKRRQEDLG
jgi:hypothetical protein